MSVQASIDIVRGRRVSVQACIGIVQGCRISMRAGIGIQLNLVTWL
jgi:hypothetical protein